MLAQPWTDLIKYAYLDVDEICRGIGCSAGGLPSDKVDEMSEKYGKNVFAARGSSLLSQGIRRAFINPFHIILFILGIISVVTEFLPTTGFSRNFSTSIIILAMILISGAVRLTQELKAKNAAEQLDRMIRNNIPVKRDGKWISAPAEELVVGDLVSFSAGDRVPADIRITKVTDLFISQAALTGESDIFEKDALVMPPSGNDKISECKNLAFMATAVISGKGEGIVIAVGKGTLYGSFAAADAPSKNSFQKGANSIALVMLKFMAALIPVIFILLGLTGGKWVESFAFALSVAVGLVPEMLPMVITACLAKGSLTMSRKQTIVKDINAMQSFGSMDILCMDKTGTLTNESILLEYYMDILGNESKTALDLSYLNSVCHSGTCNPIDNAILASKSMPGRESHFDLLLERHLKLDEIPFDYSRKFVSVLVSDGRDETMLVMKGDVNNVISRCSRVEYRGEIIPIAEEPSVSVSAVVDEMLEDGMKVIAVARKSMGARREITLADERDMILVGYLAFFDAPKATAKQSIAELQRLKVTPKILTGDRAQTAKSICRRVDIPCDVLITGEELNAIPDERLEAVVERVNVFAELTPLQKARVVSALRENGHTVGFLGDGINDIPVLNEADVGISVDTAVDAAKDSADVVLLHKDLTVLDQGIIEGRKIFTNMLKYIKITASSNFGNIFSIVCASAFLPFLPMASIQILLLNLLYDILCIVLPWDNVDEEEIAAPKSWSGRKLARFMLSFGPISSLFDMITFLFLYFVLCPAACGGLPYHALAGQAARLRFVALFQTGWFLESLWTQVLILHCLRTAKVPFKQSRPSVPVMIITIFGVIGFTVLTFTKAASFLGLTRMPLRYFGFLLAISLVYMLFSAIVKYFYQRKYHELI